jgi:ATP-dependent exoDNAse (exonuclease V) beta subunit
LTYVAATRARDLLVVPVVATQRWPGWVDVLHPVLYPKHPRKPSPAIGCPPSGVPSEEDSYEERPLPGAHVPERGGHTVVWWDPRALALGKEDAGGLRQQRILALDEGGEVAEAGRRTHEEWQARRGKLLEDGKVPRLRVEIASQQHTASAAQSRTVAVETTSASGTPRPAGRRFGTLVHAVLAATDLAASPAQVAAVALAQARLLGATVAERDAAALAVVAALQHSLFASARDAAGACRREVPILLREPDGSLLEGVIDLVYRKESPGGPEWVVVDYKTDRELERRQADHGAQVSSYVRAIEAATGEPARGVLLRV